MSTGGAAEARPRRRGRRRGPSSPGHWRLELHLGDQRRLRQLDGNHMPAPAARRTSSRAAWPPAAPSRWRGSPSASTAARRAAWAASRRARPTVHGRLAAGRRRAHARDVGRRDQAAAVAEAGADVRRDRRRPTRRCCRPSAPSRRGRSCRRAGRSGRFEQDLDDVVAMPLDARRSGERRRELVPAGAPGQRRADAVGAVAGEAARASNTSLPCCSRFCSSGVSVPRRPPPKRCAAGVSSRVPMSATPFAGVRGLRRLDDVAADPAA